MKRILFLIAVAVATFTTTPLFAQWTQAVGAYYGKAQGTLVTGNQGFGLDGELFEVQDFTMLSLSLYGEYGVARGHTITFNGTPIGYAKYGDNTTPFVGPLTFGDRIHLYKTGPLVLATEVRAGIDPGIGDDDLADEAFAFSPVRGFGLRFEGVAQAGVSVGLLFAHADFGARFNWYNPDSDVDLIGTLGVGLNRLPLGVVLSLFGTFNWALEEPAEFNISGASPTRYIGAGIGIAMWPWERVGFSATFSGAPYAVNNAGAPVIGVGVQFK